MITGRPARYVKNKLIEDLLASDLRPVEFPAQLGLTAPLGNTGDRELTALFAGQSAVETGALSTTMAATSALLLMRARLAGYLSRSPM